MTGLISPTGEPISSLNGIPVICMTPSGPAAIKFARRPPNIEAAAYWVINNGGRYRVELVEDGKVKFTATADIVDWENGGEPFTWEMMSEITPPGPEHLKAIDRVVLASLKYMSASLV